jgi:DNA polymerase (family 10)
MTLLHGAQLDIAPDGSLVGDPAYYRELDWRVASVRSDFDLDSSRQTKRILTAMENPLVNAIAHLTGRQLGARPGMELDFDAVFHKAAETGTAIEITALLDRLDPPSDALFHARDSDVTFILTSEAQTPPELRHMYLSVRQAQRGGVGPSRIANCWPQEKFLSWLKRRH